MLSKLGIPLLRPSYLGVASFATVYLLAAAVALAWTRSEVGIAALWPPNALLLAALLITRSSKTTYLIVAFALCLATNLAFGASLAISLKYSAINVAESFLAFVLASRLCRSSTIFDHPADVLRFTCVVAGSALASAAVASSVTAQTIEHGQQVLISWFAASFLASTVVTPIAILLVRITRGDADVPLPSKLEIALLVIGTAAVAALTFSQDRFPLLFLPTAAVIVTTYRTGPLGAATSISIVGIIATTLTSLGSGPLSILDVEPSAKIKFLQVYLSVTYLSMSPLAATLAEGRALLREAMASEQRVRAIINQSGDVIFETDLRGRWTLLNQAWTEITGWPVEKSLGASFLSTVHTEDRQRVIDNVTALYQGANESFAEEMRFIQANGEVRWALVKARLMRDENGAVTGTCGTMHDVTARKLAEAEAAAAASDLGEVLRLLELAGSLAHLGYWRVEPHEGTMTLSEECGRILGLPAGVQPLPEDLATLYHIEDREAVRAALALATEANEFAFSARVMSAAGTVRFVQVEGIVERSSDQSRVLFGIIRDVTKQHQADEALRESEERFRELANSATDIMLELDADGNCWFASEAVERITGFTPDELLGRNLAEIIHPDDRKQVRAANIQVLKGEQETVVTCYRTPHKNGEWLWVEAHLRADLDPVTGEALGLIGSARDVTRRKTLELEVAAARLAAEESAAQLYKLATTDELTGLANRRHFMARLTEELTLAERTVRPFCLAIFDIDHFKRVNDTHGHDGGDAILRAVATVASTSLRSNDLIGRLGGEEFGLLLSESDPDIALEVTEYIREQVAANVVKLQTGAECSVTISIGLAAHQNGQPVDELIRRADQALYQAKGAGRDCLRMAA